MGVRTNFLLTQVSKIVDCSMAFQISRRVVLSIFTVYNYNSYVIFVCVFEDSKLSFHKLDKDGVAFLQKKT